MESTVDIYLKNTPYIVFLFYSTMLLQITTDKYEKITKKGPISTRVCII